MPEKDWPDWLQARREFVPGFIADYVSFDAQEEIGQEREQNARLLLVVRGALAGYKLDYRRMGRTDSACWFASAAVPISAVRSIARTSRVDAWGSGLGEREQAGAIQLAWELEGWGQTIELPLDTSVDYGAKLAISAKAAATFLDALQSELALTRPSPDPSE